MLCPPPPNFEKFPLLFACQDFLDDPPPPKDATCLSIHAHLMSRRLEGTAVNYMSDVYRAKPS